MIDEVDESLRHLIRDELGPDVDVEVVFDAPTKDWAARRNAPTIDVYLYDIREDLRRRQYGVVESRDRARQMIGRHEPAWFFKLSYLLTAWTQRPEDEHRLLSTLLHCFLRHDHLPSATLTGGIAEEDVPFALTMAIPPPEDRALSDVWSALGGELKPSLDLVVIAPVDLDREQTLAKAPSEPPVVRASRRDGADEESRRARPSNERLG